MAPKTRAMVNLAMITIGFVGVALGTIGYVQEQQRNICSLVVLLDDRNQQLPPTLDKDTADYRAELHRYRLKIGC
jgi:hypothetical protein